MDIMADYGRAGGARSHLQCFYWYVQGHHVRAQVHAAVTQLGHSILWLADVMRLLSSKTYIPSIINKIGLLQVGYLSP